MTTLGPRRRCLQRGSHKPRIELPAMILLHKAPNAVSGRDCLICSTVFIISVLCQHPEYLAIQDVHKLNRGTRFIIVPNKCWNRPRWSIVLMSLSLGGLLIAKQYRFDYMWGRETKSRLLMQCDVDITTSGTRVCVSQLFPLSIHIIGGYTSKAE